MWSVGLAEGVKLNNRDGFGLKSSTEITRKTLKNMFSCADSAPQKAGYHCLNYCLDALFISKVCWHKTPNPPEFVFPRFVSAQCQSSSSSSSTSDESSWLLSSACCAALFPFPPWWDATARAAAAFLARAWAAARSSSSFCRSAAAFFSCSAWLFMWALRLFTLLNTLCGNMKHWSLSILTCTQKYWRLKQESHVSFRTWRAERFRTVCWLVLNDCLM